MGLLFFFYFMNYDRWTQKIQSYSTSYLSKVATIDRQKHKLPACVEVWQAPESHGGTGKGACQGRQTLARTFRCSPIQAADPKGAPPSATAKSSSWEGPATRSSVLRGEAIPTGNYSGGKVPFIEAYWKRILRRTIPGRGPQVPREGGHKAGELHGQAPIAATRGQDLWHPAGRTGHPACEALCHRGGVQCHGDGPPGAHAGGSAKPLLALL